MTRSASARGIVILSAALLTACASSPPATFYRLTSEPSNVPDAVVSATFTQSIAVGPVSVPEAVNRPQFVVSDGPNRVVVLESCRWASPLKNGIAEAVALDLSRDLGARVVPMTQSAADQARFDVSLDVQRFDLVVGDAALLEVVWTIKRRDASIEPILGRSSVREPVQTSGDPYDGLVAAQVRALASVAREIAAQLRQTSNDLAR